MLPVTVRPYTKPCLAFVGRAENAAITFIPYSLNSNPEVECTRPKVRAKRGNPVAPCIITLYLLYRRTMKSVLRLDCRRSYYIAGELHTQERLDVRPCE